MAKKRSAKPPKAEANPKPRPTTAAGKTGKSKPGGALTRAKPPRRPSAPPPALTDPRKPPWVPDGTDLHFVPPQVQQAAEQLVVPIYQQLVLDAPDALERTIGVTLVHLLWLETIEQLDLKRDYTEIRAVLKLPLDSSGIVTRHLRLIDSKIRAGNFLLRLRELRRRAARQDADTLLPEPPGGGGPPAGPPSLRAALAIGAEIAERTRPLRQERERGKIGFP